MVATRSERFSIFGEAPAPRMLERPNDWLTRGFLAFSDLLRAYHRHRIWHLERLGDLLTSGRRVILVANHAFNIVDPLLLLSAVFKRYGVMPRSLAHEAGWFRT